MISRLNLKHITAKLSDNGGDGGKQGKQASFEERSRESQPEIEEQLAAAATEEAGEKAAKISF